MPGAFALYDHDNRLTQVKDSLSNVNAACGDYGSPGKLSANAFPSTLSLATCK